MSLNGDDGHWLLCLDECVSIGRSYTYRESVLKVSDARISLIGEIFDGIKVRQLAAARRLGVCRYPVLSGRLGVCRIRVRVHLFHARPRVQTGHPRTRFFMHTCAAYVCDTAKTTIIDRVPALMCAPHPDR